MTTVEELANTFEEFGFELSNNIVERCKFKSKKKLLVDSIFFI